MSFLGETYGFRSISTITCNDALVYSDELLNSFHYRRIKKQPIALLYKKALADEEELNENSQSIVPGTHARANSLQCMIYLLLSLGEDETTLTRTADIGASCDNSPVHTIFTADKYNPTPDWSGRSCAGW